MQQNEKDDEDRLNQDIQLKDYVHMDIHETVEEYMILANSDVAQYIYKYIYQSSLES